ncbi:uncharacterized protein ACN2A1_003314 isoform 1-T1 [Glossina fuscipes fuscipes]
MSKYANPANYIEYMKILKEWRSAVRKAKRTHRAIAIKDLCGNGYPRSFWNHINGHRHSSRKLSGCAVWNDRDDKKYLDMLKSYIPIVNPITMPSIPFSSISNTPFSLHELMYVLHFRKRATAAGCDGVKYDMLTALSGGSFSMLLHAINNCWSTNFIPFDLRCIKIVPIPKPESPALNFTQHITSGNESILSSINQPSKTKATANIEKIKTTTHLLKSNIPNSPECPALNFTQHITSVNESILSSINQTSISNYSRAPTRCASNVPNHLNTDYSAGKQAKFLLDKADWINYSEQVESFSNSKPLNGNCNHDAAIMSKAIRTAAHLSIPQSNTSFKRARVPWWNNTLSFLRKNKMDLWHRFKRCPDQNHLLLYKKALFRKELRKSKALSFELFSRRIHRNTSMKVVWNKINILNGTSNLNQISAICTPNGTLTDADEISNYFGKVWCEYSSDSNFSSAFIENKRTPISPSNNIDRCAMFLELPQNLEVVSPI